MKRWYLEGNPTLVNCNLLDLIGLLSIEETRQQSLGLPSSTPPATFNRGYDSQSQSPSTGLPQPRPSQPTMTMSPMDYPPRRGVPWKCIASMVFSDTSCSGCHFNKPDESPRLKLHQEVGCPDLANHGYIFRKEFTAPVTIVNKFNNKFPRMTDQSRQPRAR